jgi:beta-ribofuranosylaminobenzene 5'-phosphate synthase
MSRAKIERVLVRAPSHLHAGNMDLEGGLGRLYGTVGFTINNPLLEVIIEKSGDLYANDEYAYRVAKHYIDRYIPGGGARIEIISRIPEYAGLGYHTTLALAVGMGLNTIYGLNHGLEDIALTLKRGLLTALGLYACKEGGFIVEGGFKKGMLDKMVPPLIFRYEIPSNWLFVIAVPSRPMEKLRKLRVEKEDKVLLKVDMPPELSAYLSRLLLMKIIPSIIEGDIRNFSSALDEFNMMLGSVWSEYQGGNYCCPIVEEGIWIMRRYLYGACQSSWGPTFYGLTDKEENAFRAVEELEVFLERRGGGSVFIARGRNRGIDIHRLD